MASRLKGGGDVFESERLDPEERSEAESIVSRHRTQQQYVH
jgi:hypothetical protein